MAKLFINFQEVYQYSMYSKKKAFFKDSYESNINKHAASKFSQFLFETLEAVIYALILMIVFMTFFFSNYKCKRCFYAGYPA